jgi:hypothetical protein
VVSGEEAAHEQPLVPVVVAAASWPCVVMVRPTWDDIVVDLDRGRVAVESSSVVAVAAAVVAAAGKDIGDGLVDAVMDTGGVLVDVEMAVMEAPNIPVHS